MAYVDKTGLTSITNKLVQGDAIKVSTPLGTNVEAVVENIERECATVENPNYVSIENRVNEFRVGQGRDFDAKEDVESGYMEIGFEGKTWQNLVDDKKWLHEEKTITSNHTSNAGLVSVGWNATDMQLLKPSTTYTLILNLDIKTNTLKNIYGALNYEKTTGGQNGATIINKAVFEKGGLMIQKFNTYSDFSRLAQFFIGGYGGTLTVQSKGMVILEGDHTQTPVEELPNYFEGIKSSFEEGVVDVDIVGKNLFNFETIVLGDNEFATINKNGNEVVINKTGVGGNIARHTNEIKVVAGEKYTFSAGLEITNYLCEQTSSKLVYTDIYGSATKENYKWMGTVKLYSANAHSYESVTMTIPQDINYVRLQPTIQQNVKCCARFYGLQITKGEKHTPYEPYNKKKISFNIGESLRSLPNGVADEIRNNNGQWELVRKVGKIVLDGTINPSGIYSLGCNENYRTIYYSSTNYKANPRLNCDKFKEYTLSNNKLGIEECVLGGTGGGGAIFLSIETKKLSQNSNEAILEWLQANPTTVYYELAEPIIAPIEPIKFETQPMGTITINSEIAPTSYQKIEMNRASQIERGIVEISELKNRVDVLETMYNTQFLEIQHKLSILGLDYELEQLEGGNK